MEPKVIPKFAKTVKKLNEEKRSQAKLLNRQRFLNGILTDISGWGSYLIGAIFASIGMMNIENIVLFAQAQNGILNLFNSMPNLLNRRIVHYVEQDPFLFSISVKDNICLGNGRGYIMGEENTSNITDEEVKEAAKLACIHVRIMEMPPQYDTVLDKKIINLSKGEKQRIALARIFLSDAEIFILDEAMSGIDAVNASKIIRNIKQLEGKTVIYICHDVKNMPDVDNVYYLKDGKFTRLDKHNIVEDEFLKIILCRINFHFPTAFYASL
mgnify:FL=1